MSIPKKILTAVSGVAILAVGIFIGGSLEDGRETTPPQTAAVGSVGQTETSQNITPSLLSPSKEGERVKVVRVVDGDTIEVEFNGKVEHVRYIGIDTPETVDPRKPVQCFGVEASKKNKELVEGKLVRLEKDITDRDKYNRLLRYVWLDDTLVNLELVAQGFATSYSYPPDIKYQDRFVEAERQAREEKLGLWTACTKDASASLIYSDILENTRIEGNSGTADASAGACAIKGNINASGEKIYHLQGCGSYAKTAIDETRGERWFCSEQEAQATG